MLGGCSAPGIYSGTQVDATRHFNPFLSGSPWEWIPIPDKWKRKAWRRKRKRQNHSSIAPGLKVAQSTSNEENPITQPHLKAGKCSPGKDPGRREAALGLCCRKVKKFGLKGDWRDCAVWQLDIIGDLPLQEYLAEPWKLKWSGQI